MIHPYCNGNPETVVLCHIGCEDKGWSIKSPDWWAVYGCSDCHNIIDDKVFHKDIDWQAKHMAQMRALYRTHKRMIEKGLIKV